MVLLVVLALALASFVVLTPREIQEPVWAMIIIVGRFLAVVLVIAAAIKILFVS